MSADAALRDEMCLWGRSLFERGLSPGASGNLSARAADGGLIVTPTDSCLGFLDPARLTKLDPSGAYVDGDRPTKETPLHLAYYRARPSIGGVVHLHSTFATAVSCLEDIDPDDAVPPLTPYVVMRVGRVPVLPYSPPGSEETGRLIERHAGDRPAVLLENHGPVVTGASFRKAVFAAEELEEACRLYFLSKLSPMKTISPKDIEALTQKFG